MLLLVLRPVTPLLLYGRSMVPDWCITTIPLSPLLRFLLFHLVVDFVSFCCKRCIAYLVAT